MTDLFLQAQLTVVYSIAFQLTNKESHQETVEDILTYVTRDLAHPLGGFFTAEVMALPNSLTKAKDIEICKLRTQFKAISKIISFQTLAYSKSTRNMDSTFDKSP